MPGDPSLKASGGIIAYNGDSARGWNDPPTFAFSNNKTGNKPKLDLRKRVSHQQALHGVQAPSPSVPAAVVNSDEIANGIGALKLNGVTQPLYTPPPVTTTAPLVSNNLSAPSIPTMFTRSISTPSFCDAVTANSSDATVHSTQAVNPPAVHAKSTENLSGNLGQPLFALKDHSFEPVRTAPLHSIRSTAEISDHFDDHHDNHSSPQIFHPITPPVTTATGMPNYPDNPPFAQPSIPPLGQVTPPPPLPSQPPVGHKSPAPPLPSQPPVGHRTPPLYPVHRQSPVPPTIPPQGNGAAKHPPSQPSQPPVGHISPAPPLPSQPPVGHITPPLYPVCRQSPVPPTIPPQVNGAAKHPPMGHSMTPPPPPGNHVSPAVSLSAGNTPRSTSPTGDEKNGAAPSSVDNQEGLKITMDALQDVVYKLHDTLEKRVADDIARRLQVMCQNWTSGKLSQGVKSRMIKLAQALDSGNAEEAHHIHISLMVDFVSEVNQWMVAVKKLISLVRTSSAFPSHS